MNGPSPARTLAEAVAPHFAQHAETARGESEDDIAVPPAAEVIEEIAGAAFWASLRREEGYTPTVSLAYVAPDSNKSIRFDRSLPLSSAALTKVAPAVERPGVHLGVWPADGELRVWGTIRDLPSLCFVLEVIAPGLLVVKHSRPGEAKFVNVAVVEGDQIKVLGESAAGLVDCPGVNASLLGFSAPVQNEFTNVLVQIAVSMRDHGRGGLLVVVNDDNDDWRQSVLQPILYAVAPPFSELAELVADRREHDQTWHDALRRSVAMVAGLTAVDGATILNRRYELLAFGAKLGRRRDSRVEQLLVTEPVIGAEPQTLSPAQFGGTRHLAAAQFVYDQHDAAALVASQDGRFTVFAWSPCDNMVRAHRVESLLL